MGEAGLVIEQNNINSYGTVTNDKLFDILFTEEDITWQTLIYQLVETHQMNPWDIDVSLLSKKFIETLKKLKELDFRISGKVVLASAILLRIKSTKFLSEDINAFDYILHSTDRGEIGVLDDGDISFFEESSIGQTKLDNWIPQIFPRTPQPRKRKVSIYDLVNALEKALEVKNRRVNKPNNAPIVRAPVDHRDISLVIKDVYEYVLNHFNEEERKLIFENMIPENASKDDKVMTFIPLLHLRNQQKVELFQDTHFGEIEIQLWKMLEQKAIEEDNKTVIDNENKSVKRKKSKVKIE